MYETCPKCGHKRTSGENENPDICPACGLIFSKWMKQRFQTPGVGPRVEVEDTPPMWQRMLDTVTYIPEKTEKIVFYGRALVFVVLFFWGWTFILMSMQSNEIGVSFMHNVNLVFHEAGHVVFRPFGRFMTILGGSLLQLLVPVIVILAFIWKNQDNFGAAVGLWWLAQSLMDLAPYINDARAGQLILLGGVTGQDMPGIHDWKNILTDLHLLSHDHGLARFVDFSGELLMLLSFAWGGYILYLQYRTTRG